jgi:hypothetical protein
MPPDGARGVPTNAGLSARYALTAEYLDEEVTLGPSGSAPSIAQATFDRVEAMLRVQPAELLPQTNYEITWPGLRGLGTASLGNGATVEFETGNSTDDAPPAFGGLSKLSWHLERERDECTDTLEERFVFELGLSEASDDGGRESLTLIVFQTVGPGIEAGAPEQVAVMRMPEASGSAKIARRVDDAVGDVCFAGALRDLTGRISSGAEREVCVHTASPPFFHGCLTVASAIPLRSTSWSPLIFALLTVVWRRRRRS